MDSASLLVAEMAVKCRCLIQKWGRREAKLPKSLHAGHLLWMCQCIDKQAETWPATKLHRWIGFVQCGMLANGMPDADTVNRMFDDIKIAYEDVSEDLMDHLDPDSSFHVDIGGES